MRRSLAALVLSSAVLTGCGNEPSQTSDAATDFEDIGSWVYQLTGYQDDSLDEIAEAPHDAAVIDLARDGGTGYFTADEIAEVRETGKQVFAYFSMGSIETYRPEYDAVAEAGLELNRWDDWPDEYFVTYWQPDWWELAVKPRLDIALKAGFDGVYLDVPNAYEEIDLDLVPGRDRDSLAAEMVAQIIHISQYAKERNPRFRILPQNSPELRDFDGYTEAIDGLGVEDLFYLDTDIPCRQEWCAENLADVEALAKAGKLILSVDYAQKSDSIADACDNYAREGFAGYVTVVALDRIKPPCR